MIVFSQNLILSPGGIDLNAPVIGWRTLVKFGSIVADSEDPDFPAAHLGNPATTHRWLSLITTTQYVTIDTDADEMVDYIGIARHNFGTGMIAISVEAFVDGVWTEVFPPMTPADDTPRVLYFSPTLADEFRLKLVPSIGVAPTMAVLYIGKLLQLQRRIYVGHTPLPYGRDREFTNGVAESGDFQGRVELRKRLETSVNLQNMTPSWYRDYLEPFIELGVGTAFFFAWRPYTYPREVGYAWMKNNPKPVNQRSNGMMQINMTMGGLVI